MTLVTTCDACGIFEVELHHNDARDRDWPFLCNQCLQEIEDLSKKLENRKNVENEFRKK